MEITINPATRLTRRDFTVRKATQGSFASSTMITGVVLGFLAGPGHALSYPNKFYGGNSEVKDTATYATPETKESLVSREPAADLIQSIKDDWHLNMTELAEIFGVTRPTLYSWVKGKTKPDPASLRHLQVITAAGRTWAEQTHGKNWDYILDYTGPEASDITLRERMKASDITVEELKVLIPQRIAQYQKAREEVKKIIGDPKISSGMPIRESTRKLNKRWTDHAQKLHRLRNASHE